MNLTAHHYSAFVRELYGYSPFPWQQRLVAQVLADGRWPDQLDLPTGTGKTSAIDIAVFCMAVQGAGSRTMPRRVVYIVDRRVIVDQTADRAEQLAAALQAARQDPAARPTVAAVADRLSDLSALHGRPPLLVKRLRGAVVRDDSWVEDPAQPLVLSSTVDQVGSRLLFRGYGVSHSMSPVHAGLVGQDCLYLLDEVHLSQPFEQTLQAVADRARVPSPAERWQVVSMSATPAASSRPLAVFSLASDDRAHPVLQARLGARRPATVQRIKAKRDDAKTREVLAKEATKQALSLAKAHHTLAVVVNRVDTARRTFAALHESLAQSHRLVLLTGRMRGIDRDRTSAALAAVRAGRSQEDPRPTVVVSTQCIEAGADLDFDALVTESASLSALRQRFGRLNRLGQRDAQAVILHAERSADPDPIYGTAPEATVQFLEGLGDQADFGLAAMDAAVAAHPSPHDLETTRPAAPLLLPTYLDLWVHTRPRPYPDPPVGPWLHGPDDAPGEVQVVWRDDLETPAGQPRDLTELQALLAACPPASIEALSVPLHAARAWLSEQPEEAVADVPVQGDVGPGRRRPTRRWWLRWAGAEHTERSNDPRRGLRPGDTIVVPSRLGGVDPITGVWDPSSTHPVSDVGDLAQWLQRERPVVRAHRVGVRAVSAESEDPLLDVLRRLGAPVAGASDDGLEPAAAAPGPLAAALAALASGRAQLLEPGANLLVVVGRPRSARADFVEGDETSSFTARATTLRAHSGHVRDWVQAFCARLDLPPALAQDLALAAWLHDLGKADPRFQQMLSAGDPIRAAMLQEPLAKSAISPTSKARRDAVQRRSGYPRGMRHELMSLALITNDATLEAQAHDWDLVRHLVASHHGWCRPAPPPVLDAQPVSVSVAVDGRALSGSSGHTLARLDSPLPARFAALNARYGAHTLAWLEALLRLADHRASQFAGGPQ